MSIKYYLCTCGHCTNDLKKYVEDNLESVDTIKVIVNDGHFTGEEVSDRFDPVAIREFVVSNIENGEPIVLRYCVPITRCAEDYNVEIDIGNGKKHVEKVETYFVQWPTVEQVECDESGTKRFRLEMGMYTTNNVT